MRVTSLTADAPNHKVTVTGTATDLNGNALSPDQIEQRLVSGKDLFAINGKRDLRATVAAGANGKLAYDGENWTATYEGLSDADVLRASNAEARILWLGKDPAAGTELTIYEASPDVAHGPSAPCTAPSSEPNAPTNSPIPVNYIKSTDPTPPTTPSPVLAFNPQSVTFGTISAGTSKQQTLTIRNAGTAPVTFTPTSIALTQTDPTANVYSISAGTCTGTVQVNKTCNAVVSLNTNTRTVRKTYTGTVKVFTFSVNVTGTIK